jgi:putative transposase
VTFTDEKAQFISEASIYRLLRANGLLTSPAFIVMNAADEFRDKTTAPNQLWQTDFTYLKVIGWGWFYLATILDDLSRFIVAWKLCATMKAAGRHRDGRDGVIGVGAGRKPAPAAT